MMTMPLPLLVRLNQCFPLSELTLISASKCDDISCSEVIRALRLEDDPILEEIEERLATLRHDVSEAKKRKNTAVKDVNGRTSLLA